MPTRRWLLALTVLLAAAAGQAVAQPAARPAPPHPPTGPSAAQVHVASFGLWGAEAIFTREAHGAARAARAYFAAMGFAPTGAAIARANSATAAEARVSDMREHLKRIGAAANRDADILFLFLTSHGTQDGIGIVTPTERRMELLSPRRLGRLLRDVPIRHKIVVISACFSGVFADALADETTLVMTAADANHPSFGCGSDVKDDWTYFGRALFVDGLQDGRSLDEAFAVAKRRVLERETAQKFEHSNPQMRGGKAVRTKLSALAARPVAR